MTSMFRHSLSALLLTLACAPTAHAFPPCPIDEAGIVPLDGPPTGSAGLPAWKVATAGSIGTLPPESFVTACQRIPNGPKTGECKVDVFHLDALPEHLSAGAIAGAPLYSETNQVGVIGLPDLRNTDVATHTPVYGLTLGINATPLANSGDWIDIAQMELDADPETGTAEGAIYRLRKIAEDDGRTTIRLILSMPDTRQDTVVASAPLDPKQQTTSITLRWSPHTQPADVTNMSGEPGSIGASAGYSVDTRLSLIVDGRTVYAATLKQQAPTMASVGLLDYNLPATLHAIAPEDPIIVPIGPLPVSTDALLSDAATDTTDPLDKTQNADVPGALLVYYYTLFSVVSK